MTQWKEIEGFDGYLISDDGNIKSSKYSSERLLKPWKNPSGYMIVQLRKNGETHEFRMHRLVASAFIDNPENKPEVNHKDGNKANNRVENLEWVTSAENKRHAYEVLRKTNFGRKLTSEQVADIRNSNENISSLARKCGVTRTTIRKILNDKTYTR